MGGTTSWRPTGDGGPIHEQTAETAPRRHCVAVAVGRCCLNTAAPLTFVHRVRPEVFPGSRVVASDVPATSLAQRSCADCLVIPAASPISDQVRGPDGRLGLPVAVVP